MSMLKGITDREDSSSIIIDADSLLFSSCYAFKDNYNIELAYMNFMERIGSIRTEAYTQVIKLDELLIAFTSSTNFRYDIYPKYKANRGSTKDEVLDLVQKVKELKKLVYERVKPIVLVSNVFEADDICIQYADKGWMVSAIDKDVINACPTQCFNYKKGEWNKGRTDVEIRDWYLIQSIMGDTSDGIKGVKGMGEVKAKDFITLIDKGIRDYNDYIDLFETPADCLLMNRLVRMNQYDKEGKLKLITIQSVIDEILPF